MPANLFHLFHGDDASLTLGSLSAFKSYAAAQTTGVDVEVFCFGPALQALGADDAEGAVAAYNETIDQLIAADVAVTACLNAANTAGLADRFRRRGIALESAVDVFARCADKGTNVITF